ncbi:MAG: serine hydrolase [Hyphomonadaceae bacterium]|nr:serine hydrolase [Hyphomonadaceae bacterium]
MPAMLSRLPLIAAIALISISATPALAQKPVGKEPVASILTWTQKQQLERYPAIEKAYQVATIKKGAKVSELPKADKQVDPKVTFNGKSSSVDAFMTANRITGLIAVKDGKIVLEKYALGRTPEQRWTSFSVAKSVTSTLIGAAIKDGYIRSIYDPITRYLPELEGTAYDDVTLEQVVTMTSGAKWNEDYADPKSDVAQAGAAPYKGGINPLLAYMSKLKREAPPGTKFVYKTGETDLAGLALSRALAGKSLADYASEKLWAPYGMEQDAIWMLDKAGHERGGCCMSMTLRDYARIGLFMLGGGKINGKDVLPSGWVEDATTNQLPKNAKDASYGYFWWPLDAPNYQAIGVYGQGIVVYPEENLVIALNSAMPKASDRKQSQAKAALFKAVRDAANGS